MTRRRFLLASILAAGALLLGFVAGCSEVDGWTVRDRSYFIAIATVGGWSDKQAVCATKTLEKQYAWDDFRAQFVVADRPGGDAPLISVPEPARPVLDACPK